MNAPDGLNWLPPEPEKQPSAEEQEKHRKEFSWDNALSVLDELQDNPGLANLKPFVGNPESVSFLDGFAGM